MTIGSTYRAWGPSPESKLGPASEVLVVGKTKKGWVTEAPRQVASLIAFGCEHMWTETSAPNPLGIPGTNLTLEIT